MKTIKKLCLTPYVYCHNDLIWNCVDDVAEPVSETLMKLLEFCQQPRLYETLIAEFGIDTVQHAIQRFYICDEKDLYRIHKIQIAEIETINYCNFQCIYCPASHYPPQKKKVMDLSLFEEILRQLQEYQTVKFVTFNAYGEPLLDPVFEQRLQMLSRYNIRLVLHTNGSLLTKEKVKLLLQSPQIEIVTINLPSLDTVRYERMTNYPLKDPFLDHVKTLVLSGMPVNINVNGTHYELYKNLPLIEKTFASYSNVSVSYGKTNDRAGILQNQYQEKVYVDQCLFGCDRVLKCVNISADGEVYICCNDYFQTAVIGNVRKEALSDLLNGEMACIMREKIFGARESSADFICRRCSYMSYTQKSLDKYRLKLKTFR